MEIGGEMLMPEDNVQTETAETAETEITETETVETKETPEVKTEETVETTQETETDKESKTEIEETTEIKETETEPEKPTETETDEDVVDVDALLDDIKDKDKQVSTLSTKFKQEQKKVELLKGQVDGLEAVVSGLIDTKMQTIPEEYHNLIPDGNLISKLDWMNKAEASGLFSAKKNPNVEIGKPLNLGNKDEKANSNTSAQQKLSNYFSNFYNK